MPLFRSRTGAVGGWAGIALLILLLTSGREGWGDEGRLSRFTTMEGGKNLSITSGRMLIKNQENSVLFEGSVVMERDGVILQAGKVEILFLPTEGTPSSAAEGTPDKREISTITADQDVRLTQGERTITSHHVIYYRKEEKMVFTGDPMVREKEDEVHGDRITIYLKEDRALIEGGEAVLHPK